MRLTIVTYNLENGGCDDGDDARLWDQVNALAEHHPDVVAFQEAKWPDGHKLLDRVADQLGMTFRTLVRSNFHGCDIAVLVRERPGLRVGKERHLTGPPFSHCHADVELKVKGRTIRFMAGHAAPSSPTVRLAEAEMVTVYRNLPVIYVADFNAATIDEKPDVKGLDPHYVNAKLDTAPAFTLAAAGFIDVGARRGELTPTVGHAGNDRLAYRCDRVYTTLPDTIADCRVLRNMDDLSDHRPVLAAFDLPNGLLTDQEPQQDTAAYSGVLPPPGSWDDDVLTWPGPLTVVDPHRT